MSHILLGERAWFQRIAGVNEIALQWLGRMLPAGTPSLIRLTSLYIRIPKTPRTEPGKNDLHYCQRTTASGDCRLRPAGAERSWFGNGISGWAVRLYVSKRKTRAKSITASLGRWQSRWRPPRTKHLRIRRIPYIRSPWPHPTVRDRGVPRKQNTRRLSSGTATPECRLHHLHRSGRLHTFEFGARQQTRSPVRVSLCGRDAARAQCAWSRSAPLWNGSSRGDRAHARVLPGAIQRREITPNRNFFQIAMYFWTIFASLMFEGTFYVRR